MPVNEAERRARRVDATRRWRARHPEWREDPETRRSYRLKSRYGITAEEFEEMRDRQHGACLLCTRTDRMLVPDHNHETGEVRGLLCRACNTALGQFGDDPEQLRLAADYLEGEHRA